MAQTLDQRDATSSKVGGWMHILLPKIGGGFKSWKISVDSLLSGAGDTPIKLQNKSTNTSCTVDANTYIKGILAVQNSGTPTLKIGKTPNGEEVMPQTNIVGSMPFPYVEHLTSQTTLYLTISGGNISVRIDISTNAI